MKKKDKKCIDSIDALAVASSKAGEALADVAKATGGLRSTITCIDEMSRYPDMFVIPKDITIAPLVPPKTTEPQEEWIWVDGYKGTDKDMRCREYQFALGEVHSIPADQKVELCENGFHLCLKINDVFSFYGIGKGNRFFKVKAYVRKKDYEMYGKPNPKSMFLGGSIDKLVARSIQFISELTPDEIFTDYRYKDWTLEEKELALAENEQAVEIRRSLKKLTDLGYSVEMAEYIMKYGDIAFAYALGTQKDLTMHERLTLLFSNKTPLYIDTDGIHHKNNPYIKEFNKIHMPKSFN